jgi:RNA polymerase sigma-70 factor (ECF subfamily)
MTLAGATHFAMPSEYPLSFKEVYDTHFAFVWRSLQRLRVSDLSLSDALQDVFIVVYRRLGDFEGRAKLSTWLFGICLRVAKDYRCRAHVRSEVLDDSNFATIADPQSDAGAVAERNQELALFDAALDNLHQDQRAVFVLFELEDMTGDEIAASLRIPLGTVYSRLRLARRAFKRAALAQTWRREAVAGPGVPNERIAFTCHRRECVPLGCER